MFRAFKTQKILQIYCSIMFHTFIPVSPLFQLHNTLVYQYRYHLHLPFKCASVVAQFCHSNHSTRRLNLRFQFKTQFGTRLNAGDDTPLKYSLRYKTSESLSESDSMKFFMRQRWDFRGEKNLFNSSHNRCVLANCPRICLCIVF